MSHLLVRNIAEAVFATVLCFAVADEYPREVDKWHSSHPPQDGDDRWFAAINDVDHRWDVCLREGAASVRLSGATHTEGQPILQTDASCCSMPFVPRRGMAAEGLAGDIVCAEVVDGWLIAFNKGEFGAWLWWFSPDGMRRYQISTDHVMGFARTKIGLVAIAGIAHGPSSLGSILTLEMNSHGIWEARTFLNISFAPLAFFKESSNTIAVATTDQLIRIHLARKKIDVLVDKAFWSNLYPASLISTSPRVFYLGMRHGVAKIELNDQKSKITWLTPGP